MLKVFSLIAVVLLLVASSSALAFEDGLVAHALLHIGICTAREALKLVSVPQIVLHIPAISLQNDASPSMECLNVGFVVLPSDQGRHPVP